MTTIQVPETCIPDLSVSFDVNRDWPCKRAQFISHLHMVKDNIEDSERRLARLTNAYRARNLRNWIADAEAQLERLITHTDDRPCTCRESGLYG